MHSQIISVFYHSVDLISAECGATKNHNEGEPLLSQNLYLL